MLEKTFFAPLLLGLTLVLSACTGAREIAPGVIATTDTSPPRPGEIKIQTINPNAEKWTPRVQSGSADGTVRTGYTCKVLICPEPATVVLSHVINRVPKPDKAELEKIAKETIPKLTLARSLELQVRSDNKGRIETLSSAATKFGGYDGILNETKMTIEDKSRFSAIAMILAGRIVVTINAEAGDRATARKAIDEFASSFTVLEGPPV